MPVALKVSVVLAGCVLVVWALIRWNRRRKRRTMAQDAHRRSVQRHEAEGANAQAVEQGKPEGTPKEQVQERAPSKPKRVPSGLRIRTREAKAAMDRLNDTLVRKGYSRADRRSLLFEIARTACRNKEKGGQP